jgi:hypothetical protein
MKPITVGVCLIFCAGGMAGELPEPMDAAARAAERGARWLAATQGKDGGWGQDGGETSYVRQGVALETSGNDVANTAVAALALLRMGPRYRPQVERAVEFILKQVEAAPEDGLAVTGVRGTQIQRKLGPYIDTFLTSMLLGELDGRMATKEANARVRAGLEKCVAKIGSNQLKDGSWNVAGGWAPVLGTSLASRSLHVAGAKGVKVDRDALARADSYAKRSVAGGMMGGVVGGLPAAAGIPLYQAAQAMEQLSRTEKDRAANAKEIREMAARLNDARFVAGFGSMGGEEFFSYLNISDSLKRAGGEEWRKWNASMKERIPKMQNEDGTWAGHHCITGRVAVTSAAILTLVAERN